MIRGVLFLCLALIVPGATEENISPLGRDAAAYLSDLVRINTVNPPGNERAACDYLAGVLRLAKIPFEIIESTLGRANIVARLKGDGSRKPLMLLAHLDTVGVEPAEWTFPPFSGERRDGYVLGRGSVDDKSMAAAYLAALIRVHHDKSPLKRDIIFAATADEESGGFYGVRWLLEHRPEVLDAEFAVNEGGATLWRDGSVRLFAVQVLEKGYFDMRLTARGTSGHASVPHPHNAIGMLGSALTKISEWEHPMRLNSVTRDYLAGAAEFEEDETREAVKDFLSDDSDRAESGGAVLRRHPYYAALLQDTIVPTMIEGGIRENVVSSEARLNLNVRLLPDTDPEEFVEELRRVIEEPAIELEISARPAGPPPEPMPSGGAFLEGIRRAVRRLAPKAVIVPSMSVGATDAEFLRRRGVVVYGLEFPLTVEDESRIHGNDERMPVEGLDFGTRLIVELIKELAG